MSRETHVSSPVIISRKWHLSCAFGTSRSCRALSNRFPLKLSSRRWGTYLKYRLFMLRAVVRLRCAAEPGILRNSAIIRTEDHGSVSKTCRIRASISSRGGQPELGRSLRSERCNIISCGQYFTLFSLNASLWESAASSATIAGSFIPLRWRWLTTCLCLVSIDNFKRILQNVHFHVASWIRDVELTWCKKHEKSLWFR
jgi:hypothetical protein